MHYNIVGPPSYMRSVVDRNVVMRRIPVHRPFASVFPRKLNFFIALLSKSYFKKETGLVFLYAGYRISFSGAKRPERGVDHALQSGAEAKEKIDLYLYSLCGSSWRLG